MESSVRLYLSAKGIKRPTEPELAVRDESFGQSAALKAWIFREPSRLAFHEGAVNLNCGLMPFKLLQRPSLIPHENWTFRRQRLCFLEF